MISHFREPIDIAASNFSEESAVFGGRKNLTNGIKNVIRQYQPKMIAIATTCLSETIGEDMNRMVCEYLEENAAATEIKLSKEDLWRIEDAAAEGEEGARITGGLTYAPVPALDSEWARATLNVLRLE